MHEPVEYLTITDHDAATKTATLYGHPNYDPYPVTSNLARAYLALKSENEKLKAENETLKEQLGVLNDVAVSVSKLLTL